jgi:hypothetical protein
VDESRFDAWTRRRFGMAAGGLLAALAGLGPGAATVAKKRKRKKCKKRELTCGKHCAKGECCPGRQTCGEQCLCATTIDGTTACMAKVLLECPSAEPECAANADCLMTERCVDSGCPGAKRFICLARCLH